MRPFFSLGLVLFAAAPVAAVDKDQIMKDVLSTRAERDKILQMIMLNKLALNPDSRSPRGVDQSLYPCLPLLERADVLRHLNLSDDEMVNLNALRSELTWNPLFLRELFRRSKINVKEEDLREIAFDETHRIADHMLLLLGKERRVRLREIYLRDRSANHFLGNPWLVSKLDFTREQRTKLFAKFGTLIDLQNANEVEFAGDRDKLVRARQWYAKRVEELPFEILSEEQARRYRSFIGKPYTAESETLPAPEPPASLMRE